MADTFKPRRRPLTNDMRIRISKGLQLRMLEEIGRCAAAGGCGEELVFHGGTSLSIMHGSPRWSEDLDFMATPAAARALFCKRAHIEAALQLRASLEIPGASVKVVDRSMNDGAKFGGVDRFLVRWEHPEHIGAVKVKAEFYICPPERLAAYEARTGFPCSDGIRSRSEIRAAVPLSIWADKIVAMSQRPALKHRDMHDLGYLAPLIGAGENRQDALAASMGIYGRSPCEIRQGLERDVVTSGEHDFDGLRENMARWFTEKQMLVMDGEGTLQKLFDGFLQEIAAGRSELDHMLEYQPENDGDAGCGL